MQEHTKTKEMHILQVLPALNSGGVERGTIDLALALKAKGHVPFVASQGGGLVEVLTKKKIHHFLLNLASKNPIDIFKNTFALKNLIIDHKIDIIHARSRAPAWSAYFAAKLAGIPFVTTFHGTYNFSTSFGGGIKRWYNSVMARGDTTIAISLFIQAHIQKNYGKYITPDSVTLINRGVDLMAFNRLRVSKDRIQSATQHWGLEPQHKVILVPGRLTRWKGQFVVLEAVKELARQHHNLLCIFIGSDQGRKNYSEELKLYVEQNSLQSHVRFVDHVADMPAAYCVGDLVVHASTDPEAFGRVIIEAQAMGVPIIASNIGAPATTILDGKTGWLHKAGDSKDLARVMENGLTTDHRRSIIQQAFVDVQNHYSDQLMFNKTIKVYKDLLKDPRKETEAPLPESPEPSTSSTPPADTPAKERRKILVIRHGAFGDIVKSLGAFKAIRESHQDDEIVLLTSSTFKDFCEKTDCFDRIMNDPRERSIKSYFSLTQKLYQENFDRVYDLQGSKRTGRYFKILNFRRAIDWSGNVKGCKYHQPFSQKKKLHPYERLADQLTIAGLDLKNKDTLLPDLSWLNIPTHHTLPEKFFVMIPGSSPHTLDKRWPALFYGDIALNLKKHGVKTVIIGGQGDTPIAKAICEKCPETIDLTGKTDFHEILSIARKSCGIIGNDTGPLFLACASGKPTFVPWSKYCKAELNAPRGENVHLFKEPFLINLTPNRVWSEIEKAVK